MRFIVELSNKEYNYLCRVDFLQKDLSQLVFSAGKKNDHYLLNISEDEADAIRDLCGEQLQLVGFDDKYKPTQEGEILEAIIDRFFIS